MVPAPGEPSPWQMCDLRQVREASDFPGESVVKESTCQGRKRGFNSWVGKLPWRRKWQPTRVFLPGKSHGQRSLVGYSPWGRKRVGHDRVHTHPTYYLSQGTWPPCITWLKILSSENFVGLYETIITRLITVD